MPQERLLPAAKQNMTKLGLSCSAQNALLPQRKQEKPTEITLCLLLRMLTSAQP